MYSYFVVVGSRCRYTSTSNREQEADAPLTKPLSLSQCWRRSFNGGYLAPCPANVSSPLPLAEKVRVELRKLGTEWISPVTTVHPTTPLASALLMQKPPPIITYLTYQSTSSSSTTTNVGHAQTHHLEIFSAVGPLANRNRHDGL